MKVNNLRCEYLIDPIGIDMKNPRLSFNVDGLTRQIGFEIRYSINGQAFKSVRKDTSSMTFVFPEALKSLDRVVYQVRVFDEDGNASPFSEPSFFRMGILDKKDIQAKWIRGDYSVSRKKRYPVDVFSKEFELDEIKDATLMVASLGLYEVYLNGKKVGDHVLASGSTDYRIRVQQDVYEVGPYLKKGKNELHVLLADGWYRGSIGAKGFTYVFGKYTKVLLQLQVEQADGKTIYVNSDSSFRWSNDSPLRFADLKDGEIVDNNLVPSLSKHAVETSYDGLITCSNNVHVKERNVLDPVEEIKISSKEITYRFPFNLAGYVSFECQARKGDTIDIVLGEIVDKDDRTDLSNVQCTRKKKKTPLQKIHFVCKDGRNEYHTRFFYGGFRYATVSCSSPLSSFKIHAIQIASDVLQTSKFECSNHLVNLFYENTIHSLLSNSIDIPTDCPTRERMGWTGDSQVFFNTASYLCDYEAFSRKHIMDVFDRQRKDGCLPQIAPYSHEDWYMDVMNGSVGWADVGVLTPYRMYLKYNDKRILETYYDKMCAYAKFMIHRCGRSKGIYKVYAKNLHLSKENRRYQVNSGQSYGEWAEPKDVKKVEWTDFCIPHPEESMAYTCYVMEVMIKVSAILGKEELVPLFQEYEEGVRKAYQELVTKKDFSLDTDRQAKLVRPLYFKLLNPEQEEYAKKRLIEALDHYKWRVGTGFLSTPLILYVLQDISPEYAYRLLLNEEAPGWLFMAKNNTGSIWEGWEGEFSQAGIASLNHYSKGAMVEWLFSSMLGIKVKGENSFEISPVLDPRIGYAKGSYLSHFGKVSVFWRFSEDQKQVHFDIDVPGNTTTEFVFGKTKKTLTSGTYSFDLAYRD